MRRTVATATAADVDAAVERIQERALARYEAEMDRLAARADDGDYDWPEARPEE